MKKQLFLGTDYKDGIIFAPEDTVAIIDILTRAAMGRADGKTLTRSSETPIEMRLIDCGSQEPEKAKAAEKAYPVEKFNTDDF